MKHKGISLRFGLLSAIVICWMVPIAILVAMASVMLNNSYRQSVHQELEAGAHNAMNQVSMQLQTAISDSKSVSYDGVVRSAYRSYQQDGAQISLFRKTSEYLNQSFFRNSIYKAVFISFWDQSLAQPAVISQEGDSNQIMGDFRDSTPQILEAMAQADTRIRFLYQDGELYMARNLLDSSFVPYATVVMMFDAQQLFRPLNVLGSVQLCLDDCLLQTDDAGALVDPQEPEKPENVIQFTAQVEDFEFRVDAAVTQYQPWKDNPWIQIAIASAALMVLPLLAAMILLFHRHVSRPIQVLAQANQQVEGGQWGYQITQLPPNQEFQKLYTHFNEMSAQLKDQFDQVFLEQQASQKAQIKALQSQINPHFLNNTLEIINWEARLAENDRVSAMIEALSTMLGAALDRDGRSQITLREELSYVDAYLYIIQERLGSGFLVHKDIEESLLNQPVPRLILQPIVENAVEHDITARREGSLWVRAFRDRELLVLEVEHDGTMTQQDREKIRSLLSGTAREETSVGLRNVYQRLGLIYGPAGRLLVEETPAGTIRARISFPAHQEGGSVP